MSSCSAKSLDRMIAATAANAVCWRMFIQKTNMAILVQFTTGDTTKDKSLELRYSISFEF